MQRHGGALKAYILLSERSQSEKGDMLYDPNYTTFWKRQIRGDCIKISGCQGL
jgi:hypothetical protein